MMMSVGERLMLLQILPLQGSIVTLRINRELSNKVALSEEELKLFDVKHEGEKISWNSSGNQEKEIVIGEKESDIIVDSLKKLDAEQRLVPQMMSLWDKFIDKK